MTNTKSTESPLIDKINKRALAINEDYFTKSFYLQKGWSYVSPQIIAALEICKTTHDIKEAIGSYINSGRLDGIGVECRLDKAFVQIVRLLDESEVLLCGDSPYNLFESKDRLNEVKIIRIKGIEEIRADILNIFDT